MSLTLLTSAVKWRRVMVAGTKIRAALELQPPPDAILVLTDGYTPYPEHIYRLLVVFGILQLSSGEEPPLPPVPPWKPKDIVRIPVAEPR